MNRKQVSSRILVVTVCVLLSAAAGAANLVQTHDPLDLKVGLSAWNYDTGWLGASASFGGVAVDLSCFVGGTVLDVSMNGQGKLAYPTGVNQGDLSFEGAADGGYAKQDLGIQISGKYRITIAGTNYEGDLPYMPNTDVRLADSKTFTPYQLGNSVTLSDSVSDVKVYTWNIGVKNIFSADIGVSVTASDTIQMNFQRLVTDKAEFTADGQSNPVSVTDSTLAVGSIYENLGIVPTMTFTPNIIVGITVLYIPYHITIPTIAIDVPLKTLLNPEYPTTPARSITFQVPPEAPGLAINKGTPYTASAMVTLDNASSNAPTDYMASENEDFNGATWQPYTAAPAFILSSVDGLKTVYFKTKNAGGESLPVYDTITLDTAPPTGTVFINNNNSTTTSPNVVLSLTWNDGTGSGVSRMRFSDDGAHWTAWEPLTITRAYTLPGGDGYKTLRVQYLDRMNNRSAIYSDYILLDATPPTGTIVINNNRSGTNSSSVVLALTWNDGNGSGVSRMRFSNDGAVWSAWEAPTATRAYTLPGADGYKTVRVQYLDKTNNRSAAFNDYIRLDRTAPTGSIIINNGAFTTATPSVTLRLNYADVGSGVARMRFSDDGAHWTDWEAPAATRNYLLPGGVGYQTVRVQYADSESNYSSVYSDYIYSLTP